MKVIYEIEMEIIPSENTDLISIMDHMAEAIERARQNGAITDSDDCETIIGRIWLSYNNENQPEETKL